MKIKCFLNRRTISLFLALLLAFGCFGSLCTSATGYSAQNALKNAFGYAEFPDITTYSDATAGTGYRITSSEGLIKFSQLVNDGKLRGKDVTVCLANNIDMKNSSADFVPIGNGMTKYATGYGSSRFNGRFDGCGFMIDNLTVKPIEGSGTSKLAYASLFGVIGPDATVCNLVIGAGCTFAYTGGKTESCTASVAARVIEGAKLENILNLGSVSGGKYAGGLAGRLDATTERNSSKKTGTFENCTNCGTVNGTSEVGGLIGGVRGNLAVSSCRNLGSISSTVTDASVGGMLGYAGQSEKYDGYNTADRVVSIDLIGLVNNGSVTGTGDHVGGIIGTLNNRFDSGEEIRMVTAGTVSGCVNYGTCSGKPFIGSSEEAIGSAENRTGETDAELCGAKLHGIQTKVSGNLTSVRFIGSIDRNAEYSEAGFMIAAVGDGNGITVAERDCACRKIFESLLAQKDSQIVSYTAEQLRGDEAYLFALSLEEIPLTEGTSIEFTVRVYGKTVGAQDRVYGESHTVRLTNNGGTLTAVWTA